jgi:hypothetical protein
MLNKERDSIGAPTTTKNAMGLLCFMSRVAGVYNEGRKVSVFGVMSEARSRLKK